MLKKVLQRKNILKLGLAAAVFFVLLFSGFYFARVPTPVASIDNNGFKLDLVSTAKDFEAKASPDFEFKFKKKRGVLGVAGAFAKSFLKDEYKNIKISQRTVNATSGEPAGNINPQVEYQKNGKFKISLGDLPREFKPGKYKVEVSVQDEVLTGGEVIDFSQDFTWGVLAFNVNKSIYTAKDPGAFLQMGVLDDDGHTICDADLNLEITDPAGVVTTITTADKKITKSEDCGPDSVTKTPDYYAFHALGESGQYKIKLTAQTKNGQRSITDQFEVRDYVPFDIERTGPTRIYPKADYEMKIRIKANEDYAGDITDIVPEGFKIMNPVYSIKYKGSEKLEILHTEYPILNTGNGEQKLTWENINIKAGDEINISYTFDAPDVSPDFYLLGPLRLADVRSPRPELGTKAGQDFAEARKWQIASDAISTDRVKTVQVLAGAWSGNGAVSGTAIDDTDTNQTFPSFNFSLPETGVSIKNAYIIFESQFEAYANNVGDYTGYTLSFDACDGACAPNAFTGTSTASTTDTTVLAYNESESNHARILLNISNEGNLTSYAGNGANLAMQVGYRINYGSVINSIANARAVLVLTYTYDKTSPSYANTVIYPLEAQGVGNSGTKSTSTATNCVFGTSCPKFDYTMDIPDFTAASSTKISQWFEMHNQNDLNLANDVTTQMKIGANATSSNFVLEAANSDQGNFPAQYFSGLAGFTENTAQTIEYRSAATAGSFFLLGGEATETYTASSSAPIKTRTVSFPIGVINNGVTTASTTGSVDVYFPENGPTATGTVTIKKAWLRIISNNYFTNVNNTINVVTKTGNQATSTNVLYNYDPAATVAKPSFKFIHVIPSADYIELASANASTSKTISLQTKNSDGTYQGGLSAELMITYTYTDESLGYLTSVNLFGGQMNTAPGDPGGTGLGQSATLATANSVIPETVGTKRILAGALLASYLETDSDAAVGITYTLDANLSTGTPSCVNAFRADSDAVNGFQSFYKKITPALNTVNNQAYSACYTNSGGGDVNGGAKMNGQLLYTYQWTNARPTGALGSAAQKMNGTGAVDLVITVNDTDTDDVRAKLEYVSGAACNFGASLDPTLDETPANITASSGTVIIDNASAYQVGTSTGWIITTAGANTVNFDWLSATDLPTANGDTYCVRLTANDGLIDQAVSATTTVTIDNWAPQITQLSLPDLAYKVGDTLRATITVATDTAVFTLATSTINNATTTNLQKINDTTYTLDYLVLNGDADHQATGTIPFSIILRDSYGNVNAATSSNFTTGSLDANAPAISAAVIPNLLYGINKTITATITVAADADIYALASSSINGATTTNLQKINNTTYLLDYLVMDGDTSRASGTIPYSFKLRDSYGNINTVAFAGNFADGRLDTGRPIITAVNIANGAYKIGSNISIVINADQIGYSLGTTTVNGQSVGGFIDNGNNTYNITYTVAEGDTDRTAGTIPVSVVLKDAADNPASPAFTTPSANTASVDAHKPSIVSVVIPDGSYKVGDLIRATTTVTADSDTYTLGTTTINNINVVNLVKVNDTTYTFDYTVVNGNADRSWGAIPYSAMFNDPVGQFNDPAFSGNFPNGSIDANRPVISSVTFAPSFGLLKIGDIATATIVSDGTGYTAGAMTVNGQNVAGTLASAGGNNYTVTYTVAEGHADVSDSSDLPINFVLVDSYNNQTSPAYTTADTSGRPGVDGHAPAISNVTFNLTSGLLKIGQTATATIISDGVNYTAGAITVNGQNVAGTLASAGGNNYTVTYTVLSGDTDIPDAADLPVSVTLLDTAGNSSPAYTTADAGNRPGVDGHAPVISNVTFNLTSGLLAIGQTATATIISDGVNYTAGAITVNGQNVAGTLASAGGNNYTVTYTVLSGDTDIPDANDLPISITLLDVAGNGSAVYTTADSANRPGVDGHAPVIAAVTFNLTSGLLKIGQTATATLASDGTGYTAGAITVNGQNVAGTLASAGGNNYTVTYTVLSGDTDIPDAADLPISITLLDVAGNNSAAYTTSDAGNRPGVDGHAPVISNVTFNLTSGLLAIGQTATATIISDGTGYTAGAITVNGQNVAGTLASAGGNNYTVTYTVLSGDTDIPDANDLPVSVTLLDAAGNSSPAYTTADAGNRPGVDGHAPTVPGPLSFVSKTDTGVTLNLGATTTEANFREYRIYYKVGATGVTENDTLFGSSTDPNLGNINFNGAATTTVGSLSASTTYVFNIWAYDQADNKASATEISVTTNRAPTSAAFLGQFKNNETEAIANGAWVTADSVKLKAQANDPDADETITLYFEFIPNAASFTASTAEPTGACAYGEAYGACASKIWFVASSSPADYSVNPYVATTSITAIPDSATGYKWQVLACDKNGSCASWVNMGAAPNLKIDTIAPTVPGSLTLHHAFATEAQLLFSATTTEANFAEYKIFYKVGSSGVTEADSLFGSSTDPNLGDINFNGTSSMMIYTVNASTTYVFNIWAYDQAGNKASGTIEASFTTPGSSNPPIGIFNSIAQKTNGSASVDISVTIDDDDHDDTMRAKIEYVAGTDCDFTAPLDPTIDETDANTTANVGDPKVDNASPYQVGTTSGWIMHDHPDWNIVNFDWLSKNDLPGANGFYCLRLTVSDGGFDQISPATSTVYIDNLNPTAPGALTLNAKTTNNVTFNFGATSTDANFGYYKIFYKPGSSGAAENDTEHIDANLNNVNYNGQATTTISGLLAGTQYVFNIWAYDTYGNKATSTEISVTTNYLPANPASLGQFKNDGVTAVANGGWTTENNIKLQASANDQDNPETLALYFEMISNGGSFTVSTSTPAGACSPNETYAGCVSKIWTATSSAGDYSAAPFTGTVNPANIPDSAAGFKWQVLACDAMNACSAWMNFGSIPNFKVDNTNPTTPGNLTLNSNHATFITLNFGATTTEANFQEYKIFYKQGASGVTEGDTLFGSSTDANLGYINYNGAATTTVSGLMAGLPYTFNIWTYDLAGNKAGATEVTITSNLPPTGAFVSALEKTDGTGAIDISIQADDANDDSLKAKLEYAAGADCNFASPLDPTLDETDANATSTYGDAKIDNNSAWQVGTGAGWIITSSGANTVSFDWLSETDIPAANGAYCLRLTVNDSMDNQTVLATTTVIIDNTNPTTPGQPALSSKTESSLTLSFGATTTETNFQEYKLFYKQGAGTVTEADTSHLDANLGDINFNGATTTLISSLLADTQYSFKIFAYDDYGHSVSAEQITFKTNAPPTGSFNSVAEKTDSSGAVDISMQVYDVDGDNVRAKLEYVAGADCNFGSPLDPTLDETPANISAATGTVIIDNASPFQVGTTSGWIITSAGANTVNFDWLSKTNIPDTAGTYCLRLTANDSLSNQIVLATTTVYVDNLNPTAPGSLGYDMSTGISITLSFGATSTESNFNEYKIFYKEGSAGVSETDSEFNEFDDASLGFLDYNNSATTTISGLSGSTQYVFNIWVYDQYGNKASSTLEFSTSTDVIGSATWRENEDVVLPTVSQYLGKDEPIRLRMALANTGDWQADNYNYRIQYGVKDGTCAAVASWSNVPVFAGSEHFEMIDSVYFINGASTTARLANGEGYAFTAGYMIERLSNETPAQNISGGGYTEIEYAFQATDNALVAETYCFRVTNASTTVDNYDLYPEVTIAPAPSGSFLSASQKSDASGIVDISINASDFNGDKLKAKLEYAAGAACDFGASLDPTLDETPANISATYGTVIIDNDSAYQIGSSTGLITTAYGANTVNFDWNTEADIPTSDGIFCLRLTVNDGYDDQTVSATTTVIVDHINPTAPGDLTTAEITSSSVTFNLGTSTTESNFREYKIFYKEGSAGVTESDILHGSSTDANLGYINYNGVATTTITGLLVNHQYVFKIWAYDQFGNKASSNNEITLIIRSKAKSQNWQMFYDRQNETPTSTAAAENTAPSSIAAGAVFKLRLTLKEIEGIAGDNMKTRLQYSTYSDFSSNVNFVAEIGSTTAIWTYGDGVDLDDSSITALKLTDSDTTATHNESGISTSTYDLPGNAAAEFEFTLKNNGAPISTAYYFRVFDVLNNEYIVKNTGASYPSLITEGTAMTYATQGLSSGINTEGALTTATSTNNNIDFGSLDFGSQAIAAQRFTINTNSGEGYQLFVYQNQDFMSDFGATMQPVPGTNESPSAWPASPYPSSFGYHAGDNILSGVSPSRFAPDDTYARFENSMKEISYSPIQVSDKQVDLVIKLEVTNQQSAGDYVTNLTYIIVPTY